MAFGLWGWMNDWEEVGVEGPPNVKNAFRTYCK